MFSNLGLHTVLGSGGGGTIGKDPKIDIIIVDSKFNFYKSSQLEVHLSFAVHKLLLVLSLLLQLL